MKRVHIITEGQGSWICPRLAELLRGITNFHVTVSDRPAPADLTYFLPYLFRGFFNPAGRSVGLFTHYVPGDHQQEYNRLAGLVDHCVTLNTQHQQYLEKLVGPDKVSRVNLPVTDSDKTPKLRVGWFHRSPAGYGQRKRTDLLDCVARLPWIEVVRSNGGLSVVDLHQAMRSVDVFLTTSDYESGPVSFLEALSLGKPVVIPRGCGLADEYANVSGVFLFSPGNEAEMVAALTKVYEPLVSRYQAVSGNTVSAWLADHAAIFGKVLQ